ncbi:MAG: lipase family protein [Clostridiales bacterium]|nr:lipase family protein [Clostridiales bacterium]
MIDISNVAPLMAAWVSDPWGKLRPPLSLEAVEMSAVLAQATYRMDVDAWLQAGWRDVTIQVDGDLTDGVEPGEKKGMQRLASAWRMFRVRQRIKGGNPLGEVMGALRQREKSDTGKAVVMIHPAGLGRYVVAVSFMGTGERLYDWVSNFRMTAEEGIHKGFLQLTRQFEENEEEIDFPETARELGLEKLTLRHVLEEMKNPNSRFTLWLCGHSQGAALMQIYAHHKIHEDGVLPRNMVGYGFAAPSVMSGLAVDDPSAYPLYHVQNGDDLVARMGAQVHLGMCLMYPTTGELRRNCYAWRTDEAASHDRQLVGRIFRHMTDTVTGIETTMAYLNVLSSYTTEDMLEALGTLGVRLPVKKLISAADERVDALVRTANRHMATAYASIAGKPVDVQRVAVIQAEISAIIAQIGLKAFANAQLELINQPHRISMPEGAKLSPYMYIARHGVEQLIPAIWQSGRPPRLVAASRDVGRPAADISQPELLNRRMITPRRRQHKNLRYADPRRRQNTRHITPTLEPGALKPGERIIRVR